MGVRMDETADRGGSGMDASDEHVPAAAAAGRVVPNRWGLAVDEYPGGVALHEDGSINTERFCLGPETELELSWWNKRVLWKVWREPTDHRVLVARVTENVWRVHMMVGAGVIVVAAVGLMVLGGLSPVLALALAGLVGLLGYGALVWEQRSNAGSAGIEEILEMDSVVWTAMRRKIDEEVMALTKTGQQARYDKAVAKAREIYEVKFGDPVTGKVGKTYANDAGVVTAVPKFAVPDWFSADFLDPDSRLSEDEAALKIAEMLRPQRQVRFRDGLLARYRKKPVEAERMGRGVRDCGCAACQVNRELGVEPAMSGAEAAELRAAKRQRTHTEPADPEAALSRLRQRNEQAKQAAQVQEHEVEQDADVPGTAGGQPGGLDGYEPAPEPVAPKRKRSGAGAIVTAAVVIVVLVVGAVAAILMRMGSTEPEPLTIDFETTAPATTEPTTTAPTTTAPAEPPAAGDVKGKTIKVASGDAGDQKSGSGVIAAYDHAFYVTRSAEDAIALFAPGARPALDETRNSIDAQPEGTTHSLEITPVVPGKEYEVKLTVNWPGLDSQTFTQTFWTTYTDGQFYILRYQG